MSDKDKIDLSKLTPEQIVQLEEVLTNLLSTAKRAAAVVGPGDTGLMAEHSSHASG